MSNYSKHARDRRNRPKRVYFDTIEYESISKLMSSHIDIAFMRIQQYVEKYPDDFQGIILYINILVRLGKLKEAEEYLDRLLNSKSYTKRITEEKIKIVELLKSRIEKYISSNHDNLVSYAKLAMPENSYLKQQLEDYSPERFLEHLDRHIDNDNETDAKGNKSLFRYGLDINRVIEEVQKQMSNTPKKNELYTDSYYFKLDGCGRINGKISNYFKVVCIHGTHNIINMHPIHRCSPKFCTDLNYLLEEGYQQQSQSEKFLRKYRPYFTNNN